MSERLAVVVPVRSLDGGKTRLSPDVSPDMRGRLTELMLRRVLDRVCEAGVADRIQLVSPDPWALAIAEATACVVEPVAQPESRAGLNPAIELGRERAVEAGADAMLVLFADLPLVTEADVRAMAEGGADVIVGVDRAGTGTNALRLRLGPEAASFRFRFGAGSADAHLAEARSLGLAGAVRAVPGIAFDLDTPVDWRRFLESDVARTWGLAPVETGARR